MSTPTSDGLQRKARVLIVDDHPAVREGLAYRIGGTADLCVCGEAEDVEGALRAIAESQPDVAIVDISLRGGDGLDLIQRMQKRRQACRVLVHSMFDDAIYAARSLDAGAQGYINKREAPARVMEAIRCVLAGEIFLSAEAGQRLLERRLGRGAGAPVDPAASLSNRELEVFRLIGEGRTTGQIAGCLHLSTHTIDTHRENIKAKLGLKTAAELSRLAVQWVLQTSANS